MNSILITGGSGTIGKMLIPFFLGYNYQVDNYDLLKGDDIFNTPRLVKRLKNKTTIIHLAAIPHPDLIGASDNKYWHLNFEGTKKVFQAAKKAKIKKFIYASSGCVYGFWGGHARPDRFPIDEQNYTPTLKEGLSVYGATKLAAEKFLKDNSKAAKIKTVALRIESPAPGGTRLEWINGLQNLNYRAKTSTCPAYHFFARISPENLFQAFRLAIEKDLKKPFDIFNIGNEYIHWSIDVQKWLKQNYPKVSNKTKGNQALYSIAKVKRLLGYQPYPVDDHFPNCQAIKDYYYNEPYFGKLGKP